MLAATVFSLLAPALALSGLGVTVLGLGLGALCLDQADRLVPHLHVIAGPEGPASGLRRSWLLLLAMTLHNIPEGLAVGVSFGSGDLGTATVVALGMGLQNMPEGLAIAVPLIHAQLGRWRAVGLATLSGLVELIAALVGVAAVQLARPILPFGLAFAAGAMLFVVCDELIPEIHRHGSPRAGTFGVLLGFALMMALDSVFGGS
jgi:ZIP family zinc transporter